MEQNTKTIIVTGSNKGVGYGVVDTLSQKPGWRIIMACRNVELASKSREELIAKHPQALIEVEQLDVSSSESIKKFITTVADKYKHVDVLVNNAGIAWKGDTFNPEVVQTTFATVCPSHNVEPVRNNRVERGSNPVAQ